ncbi:MAG: hypothetical protein ACLUDD_08905 [Lactobacillus kalixensis]|uniref:Uncharacterized protein n=1 Tax=Lactobacillus kalixensis DSM 16043 TaxID=1423763 RepID=A0A0R1UCW2_9LACO|nr:hypothetical protein FC46_GL001387 [Lactobacillus kalixensis DSM 16043]
MKDYWKSLTVRVSWVIVLLLFSYFTYGMHNKEMLIIGFVIIIVFIPIDYFWEKWKRARKNEK